MIGDLFGNIGDQQEQLKAKLDNIEFSESSQAGEITVTITASKKIQDININTEKVDLGDKEQIEDLLLITLNKALEKADKMAADETQKLIQEMLPPGFGNMFS